MAEPMKIRATLKGGIAEVRVLMVHPMETGQRKDPNGNIVPTHFIQEVTVRVNGKVMEVGEAPVAAPTKWSGTVCDLFPPTASTTGEGAVM